MKRSPIAQILLAAGLVMVMVMTSCAETQLVMHTAKRMGKDDGAAVSKSYKIGKPYQIKGKWYYPAENFGYDKTGIASWYGPNFHGKKTANGETYDQWGLSAAHKTLPLPSVVRVTNLDNGRSLELRINDRGPFAHGRIIDVSRRAAQLLGFEMQGTAKVRVQNVSDKSMQMARAAGANKLKAGDSPIASKGMPKATVSSENLAPPPGGQAQPQGVREVTQPAGPVERASTPQVVALDTSVSTVPVTSTRMFVQAGAFARFDNANRVWAVLKSNIGDSKISSVIANSGRELFRVRVGPLVEVADADMVLQKVIDAGYPDARIVID